LVLLGCCVISVDTTGTGAVTECLNFAVSSTYECCSFLFTHFCTLVQLQGTDDLLCNTGIQVIICYLCEELRKSAASVKFAVWEPEVAGWALVV